MDKKYNYHLVKNSKLPEDINESPLKSAKNLFPKKYDVLAELLEDWRAKKLFGSVTHYEKIAIAGVPTIIDAAIFKFRCGVIQEFKVKRLVGDNIEERNVKNDAVSFIRK